MIRRESNNYNNTRPNAEIMEVGDTFIGKLDAHNDVDCIKIVFPYRGWVKFELDIPADTDYRIRVYKNDAGNDDYAAQDIRLGDLGQMRTCSAFVDNTNDVYYIGISVNYSKIFNASAEYTLRVFYVENDSVKNALNGYKDKYNGKYWNAGKTQSQLSSSDWGVTSRACAGDQVNVNCTTNTYGGAYQCAGFALFLADVVFGDKLNHKTISDLSDNSQISANSGTWKVFKSNVTDIKLKPGDIIRKGGHSAMILDTSDEDDVKVVECWGSVGCKIYYGNFNGKSVNKKMSTILSGSIEYLLIAPIV